MSGRFKTGQHKESRGFSGTRWAQEGNEFSLSNFKIQIFNNQRLAVVTLLYFFKTDHGPAARHRRHAPSTCLNLSHTQQYPCTAIGATREATSAAQTSADDLTRFEAALDF